MIKINFRKNIRSILSMLVILNINLNFLDCFAKIKGDFIEPLTLQGESLILISNDKIDLAINDEILVVINQTKLKKVLDQKFIFNLVVNEIDIDGQEKLIIKINSKLSPKKNLKFLIPVGYFKEDSKTFIFKIFDENENLISEHSQKISSTNKNLQDEIKNSGYDCDDNDDLQCLVDKIFSKIDFQIDQKNSSSVSVIKKPNGDYTVSLPQIKAHNSKTKIVLNDNSSIPEYNSSNNGNGPLVEKFTGGDVSHLNISGNSNNAHITLQEQELKKNAPAGSIQFSQGNFYLSRTDSNPQILDLNPQSNSSGNGINPNLFVKKTDAPQLEYLTFSQMEALTSPPVGKIVYCSDCGVINGVYVYEGLNTWAYIGAKKTTIFVKNEPGIPGFTLLGSSPANAGLNCQQIALSANGGLSDGIYWIDPDGPVATHSAIQAYCDMTTDGGGWTLVLNYLHQGGTNPALNIMNASLPLQLSTNLGDDESGTGAWGHASNSLMNNFLFTELRFFARTSGHARIINFKTTDSNTISYFKTGVGSATGIISSYTVFPNHSAFLPAALNSGYGNQSNSAMTEFPFFQSGSFHWGIRGGGNRWEVDDIGNNNTHHQIWIR